ncbi:MAG: hypothetical protein JWP04_3675, partial [Belnapia sp.]|nr:hypothetical protein [Belnapia sp.]
MDAGEIGQQSAAMPSRPVPKDPLALLQAGAARHAAGDLAGA